MPLLISINSNNMQGHHYLVLTDYLQQLGAKNIVAANVN
jgi:hypothetical protein